MSSQSKHPMEEPLEKKESNKRRKYEQVEPGWGAKLDVTLNKKREPKSTIQDSPKRPLPPPKPPSPPISPTTQIPQNPQDSQPPELPSAQSNSGSPENSEIPPSNPDDSSPHNESFAQGF